MKPTDVIKYLDNRPWGCDWGQNLGLHVVTDGNICFAPEPENLSYPYQQAFILDALNIGLIYRGERGVWSADGCAAVCSTSFRLPGGKFRASRWLWLFDSTSAEILAKVLNETDAFLVEETK